MKKSSHGEAVMPTTSIEATLLSRRHKVDTLNTVKVWGFRPDIQLLRHAEWTTNTIFWDCHPDVPPLTLEP
jgi:hypothetical protein